MDADHLSDQQVSNPNRILFHQRVTLVIKQSIGLYSEEGFAFFFILRKLIEHIQNSLREGSNKKESIYLAFKVIGNMSPMVDFV